VAPKSIPEHLRAGAPRPGPSGTVDLTPAALRVVEKLGLTALVAIGGDDTLSFARRLSEEGVPVVGIPKTMDNDVHGTDYCIGFSTAVTRSVNLITDLRSSAGSHERFLVVELFGRNSGETSLITALLASADRALISEVPFDPHRVVELLLRDKRANASNYAVVTVAEGAQLAGRAPVEWGEPDAYGHKKLGGVGLHLGDYIKDTTGEEIVYQNLAYLMRSGPADSLDRMVAINFARMAADLVLAGQTGKLTAVVEGRYAVQPIGLAGSTPRRVNVDRYYDVEEYRPKLDAVVGLPMFLE
jgi:6-phosphofructokinase 1